MGRVMGFVGGGSGPADTRRAGILSTVDAGAQIVDPTPNGALRRSAAPMTATVEAPRKLAADLWNLDRLNGQGNDLIRACREVIDDLGLDERFSFAHRVLRAAELLHMADPLLPVELQPAGWPSADLRIWSEALRSRWDDEAAHRRRTLR
jgi:DNA-binding transcriptional regulator PaaX